METITERLAEFVLETGFGDIPPEVVEESKRILLDSIGCAFAGIDTEKGRMALHFARLLGDGRDSTIIGSKEKASSLGSAFANSELINSLDYEAVLNPGHVQPGFVIPAPLAISESRALPGKELLAAMALGLEISTRIGAALPHFRDVVDGRVAGPPVYGFDCSVFGAAAAAGKVMGLGKDALSHALAIGGYIAPLPAGGKLLRTYGVPTTKYVLAGWLCHSGLTAALLADLGHTGDLSVFEGEHGFWRFYGSSKWEPERLMEGIGIAWRLPSTRYKNYPCCGALQTGLDCFTSILDRHSLDATEIELVEAYLEGFCDEPMFKNDDVKTDADAQFSVAYVFSVAAHRVPIGRQWQSPSLRKDPQILDFMQKVRFRSHPGYVDAIKRDPTSTLSRVEVRARNNVFVDERTHHKGSPGNAATKMTREELIDKFRRNASSACSDQRINEIADQVFEIERVEDISRFTELLRP